MNQVLRKSKKKMMYLVGSLLISLSMFSTTSFAATEGAVKVLQIVPILGLQLI